MGTDEQRWWLDDAERLNEAHPESFFIPPRERRDSLVAGDSVKLVFRLTPVTEVGAERMWVEVVEAEGGRYVGMLLNQPREIVGLEPGDRIEFGPEHVASVGVSEEEVGYDVDAWATVSRRIRDGAWPHWVYRYPPDADAGSRDSGWQLWAFEDDDEYASRPENVISWELGWIADKYPAIESLLAAAPERGEWWWDADAETYRRRA